MGVGALRVRVIGAVAHKPQRGDLQTADTETADTEKKLNQAERTHIWHP